MKESREKTMTQWTKPWENGSHVKGLISFCQIPCKSDSRKFKLTLPSSLAVCEPRRKKGPDETSWQGALVGWAEPISPTWSHPREDRVIQKLVRKTIVPEPPGLLITHALTHQAGLTPAGVNPQDWPPRPRANWNPYLDDRTAESGFLSTGQKMSAIYDPRGWTEGETQAFQ